MKNSDRVFNPGRVLLVILSMVLLVACMAVLFSLASCSQKVLHEHNWNEGEVTEEPAFMHDGEITYTCTACSETKTEVISRGAGTEEDPYLITNVAEWNAFADYTLTDTCFELNFKLTDDISVSKMASSYINNYSSRPFRGEFDGDGHTITLSLNRTELAGGSGWNDGLALFLIVDAGCVFKNLTVSGTITTDRKYAAGFITRVVHSANVVFENCRSNVTINSSVSGDTNTAGFMAAVTTKGVNVTFNNCLFDGNFISENGTCFSGFVGFQNDVVGGTTLNFSDCAVILGEETSERLKTEEDSYTFCRTDPAVVINTSADTLYTTVLGNADRGTLAYLTQADAQVAAEAAGKTVGTKTIAGRTLYYVTEATE